MMVEFWTRKRELGVVDENDVEYSSEYEKSGIQLVWLGWDDVLAASLHAGSWLIPTISGMLNCLTNTMLSFPVSHGDMAHLLSSLSYLSSTQPSPKNTMSSHPSLSLHAMITSEYWVQHTPSTAYTMYSTLGNADHAYPIIPRSTVSRSRLVS